MTNGDLLYMGTDGGSPVTWLMASLGFTSCGFILSDIALHNVHVTCSGYWGAGVAIAAIHRVYEFVAI